MAVKILGDIKSMALSRGAAIDKLSEQAHSLAQHLLKLLTIKSDENINSWEKTINSVIVDIDDIRLKRGKPLPKKVFIENTTDTKFVNSGENRTWTLLTMAWGDEPEWKPYYRKRYSELILDYASIIEELYENYHNDIVIPIKQFKSYQKAFKKSNKGNKDESK